MNLLLKRSFNKIEVITDPIDLDKFIYQEKEQTLPKKQGKFYLRQLLIIIQLKEHFL